MVIKYLSPTYQKILKEDVTKYRENTEKIGLYSLNCYYADCIYMDDKEFNILYQYTDPKNKKITTYNDVIEELNRNKTKNGLFYYALKDNDEYHLMEKINLHRLLYEIHNDKVPSKMFNEDIFLK